MAIWLEVTANGISIGCMMGVFDSCRDNLKRDGIFIEKISQALIGILSNNYSIVLLEKV